MAEIDSNLVAPPLRLRPTGWQLRKTLPNGRRLEVSLRTHDRKLAERRASAIVRSEQARFASDAWAAYVAAGVLPKGWLRVMLANTKKRAEKKGGGLTLTGLELVALRSGGRCEVSGIDFHLDGEPRHPFRPSIDRIDSSAGYDIDNVRMVCLAVNLCMSHWGEAVFMKIAAAALSKKLSEISMNAGERWVRNTHTLVGAIEQN